MIVKMYTDGSALDITEGSGGYGVILRYEKNGKLYEKQLSEAFPHTTNNRMELFAVIKGLELLGDTPSDITIYTDSKYVVDAINKKWVLTWQRINWDRGEKGGPVKNKDLWCQLIQRLEPHNFNFVWVKGHYTSLLNGRCDILALTAAKTQKGHFSQRIILQSELDQEAASEEVLVNKKKRNSMVKFHKKEINTFSVESLLNINDTIIVFSIGGCNSNKRGYYKALMSYNKHMKFYKRELEEVKNSNESILVGIKESLEHVTNQKVPLKIILGSSVGFNNIEGNINQKYLIEIIDLIVSLECRADIYEVINGTNAIKKIFNSSKSI